VRQRSDVGLDPQQHCALVHRITRPCLVLTGELDGGCNPRLNRFIDAQLPDSKLVILPGLKHSLMIEASDQLLPELRKFLLEQS
jgi:pimeloyl-ACP methyl ester carboxylesterase